MRVAAFVILCCALQYIKSEIIDDNFNILNDKNKYETKNETTSDEFGIDPNTGKAFEKRTIRKEFLLRNGCGSDIDKGDVERFKFLITTDDQGRERIFEEKTIFKKVSPTTVNSNVGIPVASTSFSSASVASQTPQSNSSVATVSAASATEGAGSTSSAASAARSQKPASGSTYTAPISGQRAGGRRSISDTQALSKGSEEGGPYGITSGRGGVRQPHGNQRRKIDNFNNTQKPGSSTKKGDKTGTKQTEYGPVSQTAAISHGNMPTRLNFYESHTSSAAAKTVSGGSMDQGPSGGPYFGADGPRIIFGTQAASEGSDESGPYENDSGTSSAVASATTEGAGSTSSAAKAAGITFSRSMDQGPSGSPYFGADDPGSIFGTQAASEGSDKGGPYENDSGTSSATASATTEGAGSTSSAASAARSQKPASGSTYTAPISGQCSDAGGRRSISNTQASSKGSEEGGPYGITSGRGGVRQPYGNQRRKIDNFNNTQKPGSSTKKGDKTGTKQTEYGPVSQTAAISHGNMPTRLNFYESHTSSAAAKTVSGGSMDQGPSGGPYFGADGPRIIFGTQAASEGSDESGPYENDSGTSSNVASATTEGAGSTSSAAKAAGITFSRSMDQGPSGSPYFGADDPGSIFGTQAASEGSDKGGPYENDSGTSSATASATTEGAGSTSSAASAARSQKPASGSTYTAPISGQCSDAGGRRSISDTKASSKGSEEGGPYGITSGRGGVRQPYGNQRRKIDNFNNTQKPGSSTKKGDKTGTKQTEYGPVSQTAAISHGNMPTRLNFYESHTSSAAAKTVSGGSMDQGPSGGPYFGADGPRIIFGTQAASEGSALGGPYENDSGTSSAVASATTEGAGSTSSAAKAAGITFSRSMDQGPSGSPYFGADDPGSIFGTQAASEGSDKGGPYENDSGTSSATASATTEGAGSTSSAASAARSQKPASGSTYTAPISGQCSDAGGRRSISDTKASSKGSEEGGPYGITSGRGGVRQPYGNQRRKIDNFNNTQKPGSSTKKGDKTGTKQTEYGPVSQTAAISHGNMPTRLNFYESHTSSAAAKTVSGGSMDQGPSGGPYFGADGPRIIFGTQAASEGSALGGPYENDSGTSSAVASATTEGAGSTSSAAKAAGITFSRSMDQGPSGSPYFGADDPGSIFGTQASSEGSDEGGPYENDSGTSSATASASTEGAGSTSSAAKAAGITFSRSMDQGPSGSPYFGADDPGSIFGTQASSEGFEEGGPYENDSGTSSAVASATTEGAGSTSSAAKAAGITFSRSMDQGPSGSPYFGADDPGSIFGTQAASEGSDKGGPYENDSGTSSATASATTEGAGSTSSAASAARSQKPASGSTYTAPISGQCSDAGGRRSISDTKASSKGSEEGGPYGITSGRGGVRQPYGNQRRKIDNFNNTQKPGSSTKKGDKTGTKQTEYGPVSQTAAISHGNMPTRLNFYESHTSSAAAKTVSGGSMDQGPSGGPYFGADGPRIIFGTQAASEGSDKGGPYENDSGTSSATASATTEGAGSTSSAASAARSQKPASGSTYTAPISGQRAGGRRSISDTQALSKGSEEGGPYGITSGRGGVRQPYGNQRRKIDNFNNTQKPGSSTKKGDKTGTKQTEYGPVSQTAAISHGNMPTRLNFYESHTSSAAAKTVSGGSMDQGPSGGPYFGADGPRIIFGTQAASEGSDESGPYENDSGTSSNVASATTEGAGSTSSAAKAAGITFSRSMDQGPSGSPYFGADDPGSIFGTQAASEGSDKGGPYENDSGTSSATASATTEGAGSTSSAASAARSQKPASGSTYTAPISGQCSDAGGRRSISDTKASSKGSEEGGPYGITSGRGGVRQPYGNQRRKIDNFNNTQKPGSSTKKGDKTGTKQTEYGPVSQTAAISHGNMPTRLNFYESHTSSAAAKTVSGGSMDQGPSGGPYFGADGPRIIFGTQAASEGSALGGPYENDSGTSSAVASATTEGAGSTSSAAKAAGITFSRSMDQGPSGSPYFGADDPGSIFGTQASSEGSDEGGPYENDSGTSSATASASTEGAGSTSSAAKAAGITFSRSMDQGPSGSPYFGADDPGSIFGTQASSEGFEEGGPYENDSGTSSAVASATTEGAGSTSSAAKAAGITFSRSMDQGPSGSPYFGADDPGSIFGTQAASEGSDKGGPYENDSGTSSATASATTEGAGSTSSAASAARSQKPASGSTYTAPISGQCSDAGGRRSISDTKASSKGSEEGGPYGITSGRGGVRQPYGNQRRKIDNFNNTQKPGSSTKKGDKTGTKQTEYGPVSQTAAISHGNMPTRLNFYESHTSSAAAKTVSGGSMDQGPSGGPYFGADGPRIIFGTQAASEGSDKGGPYENDSGTSSATASATTEGAGSTSSAASAARSQKPASGSTYTAPISGQRAGGRRSISDTQALSKGSEEGGPYGITSGRGGVRQPYGNQRRKIDNFNNTQKPGSSTKKGDKTGTKQTEYGPVSQTAAISHGNMPTRLNFYESHTSSAAAKTVSGGSMDQGPSGGPYFGADGPRIIFGTQAASEGSDESGPYENDSGTSSNVASATTEGAGSTSSAAKAAGITFSRSMDQGPSGSPYFGADDPGSIFGTQAASEGSDKGGPYENDSGTSSATASATTEGAGSTSSAASAARSQKPASGSTYTAPISGQCSDAGGRRSISDTKASSKGSEEGGPYGITSGRGGVRQPYGNQRRKIDNFNNTQKPGSSTKKGDKTGTKQTEYGPVSQTAAISHGNMPTRLNFYESHTSSAAAKTVSGGSMDQGPSGGPYFGADGSRIIFGTQAASEGSALGGPYENDSGTSSAVASATTEGAGSTSSAAKAAGITFSRSMDQGPSGSPYFGADDPGSIFGTQASSEGSDEGGPYENDSGTSSATASASTEGAGSTSSAAKAAGITFSRSMDQGPSGSPYFGADDPGSIFGTQASSEGFEEGGPYENDSGTSSASAATEGAGSTSSAASATGITLSRSKDRWPVSGSTSASSASAARSQGPVSGSTSAAPSSGYKGSLAKSSAAARAVSGGPGAASSAASVQIHNTNRPESESSCTSCASPTIKEGFSGTQQPGSGLAFKPVVSDIITENNQNVLGPNSNGPGYYGQHYLAPQELLIIVDNAGGSATYTNRLKSGVSSGTPTTKEGVSGTQRPESGPASKPVDNITGNNQNVLEPDFYGPVYYEQDHSDAEELPTINDSKRDSESSSSPSARAPAGESAVGIPVAVPTTSGVASGVTSVQGRKRVRQACRLKSSQFVLRLGRKGQPCTFCY